MNPGANGDQRVCVCTNKARPQRALPTGAGSLQQPEAASTLRLPTESTCATQAGVRACVWVRHIPVYV